MANAKEKRAYIVELGKTFAQGKANYIKEVPENKGEELITFLKYGNSGWSQPLAWCAAFISALAGYTDMKLGNQPISKYKSTLSSFGGAGVYGGNNVKNAKPGLAIRWTNKGGSTGHVGLVIDVSESGITTVEGNTGVDKSGAQDREGVETKVKTYSWDKAKNPSKDRCFNGYIKIWDEDDSSIGTPLGNVPEFSDKVIPGSSSTSGETTQAQSVQRDLSALFINMTSDDVEIKSTRGETEIDKNVNTRTDANKSNSKITLDKQLN